jgi:TM2 domain-containing membrane protein YozV
MKKLFIVAFFSLMALSISTVASAEKYRISDASVEALFSSSILVTQHLNLNPVGVLTTAAVLKEKDALVAILLDFFLGGLAIHRVYLGGKPILIFGYLITCGGIFGIVPLIDLIVLAINFDDISKFVGNNKFFMW